MLFFINISKIRHNIPSLLTIPLPKQFNSLTNQPIHRSVPYNLTIETVFCRQFRNFQNLLFPINFNFKTGIHSFLIIILFLILVELRIRNKGYVVVAVRFWLEEVAAFVQVFFFFLPINTFLFLCHYFINLKAVLISPARTVFRSSRFASSLAFSLISLPFSSISSSSWMAASLETLLPV